MESQEYSIKPPNSESWDVFQEDESGLALANEPEGVKYKSASLAVQARSSSSNADVLAGEPAGDDIHGGQISPSQRPHVIPYWGGWESSPCHARQEHPLSASLDFTVGNRPDPSMQSFGQPPPPENRSKPFSILPRLELTASYDEVGFGGM